MEITSYAMRATTHRPYGDVLQKVTDELRKEGFGILTEIDVRDTMKKKLDIEFRKYRILGACNPPNAYRALQAEADIGLMLPCNVVVYEDAEGKTVVAAIDPVASMAAVTNKELLPVAQEVRSKLHRVIASVAEGA